MSISWIPIQEQYRIERVTFLGLSSVLPGDRLWDGLGADGNLDALLPLLPPLVSEHVVVLGVQLVRVVHLHGGDQVRPEHLQQSRENRSVVKLNYYSCQRNNHAVVLDMTSVQIFTQIKYKYYKCSETIKYYIQSSYSHILLSKILMHHDFIWNTTKYKAHISSRKSRITVQKLYFASSEEDF